MSIKPTYRGAWQSQRGVIPPLTALFLSVLLVPLLSGLGATASATASNEGFSHTVWTTLLTRCVRATDDGHSTAADYDCFAKRRTELDRYLNALSRVSEAELLAQPADQQLALLINAYNAWTVALILTEWPDVESIRDLGSLLRSPWKKDFIPLLGDTVSLDDIEHGMIRAPGRFDDPRIHFAVNCASIGCPALRNEAFVGDNIESQLEEQTQSFLADASRNRLAEGELQVSSIFKWYRGDFEKGWRGDDSLEAFLARYSGALNLLPAQEQQLRDGKLPVTFLDYDWRLNSPP